MPYEIWDESRRVGVSAAVVAVAVALVALAAAGFAWLHAGSQLRSERSARKAELTQLNRRLQALEAHDATLSSRVGSAERSLKRRDAGVAPLARRVLRSVFTIETDAGLGTGFVGWTDSDGVYVVTADHVIKNATTSVTLTRAGQSWRGDVQAEDPAARPRSGRRRRSGRRQSATRCCSSAARSAFPARSRPASSAA
jgi:S1-C subfamily serine protease